MTARSPHQVLNGLTDDAAREALTRCCGAHRWVDAMLGGRPYPSAMALFAHAERAFAELGRSDYLEAFEHHPRIGEDLAALRARFPATAAWSRGEQAEVTAAGDQVLSALRAGNRAYEARFGHVFLICAQGKSAAEMLTLLELRLPNPPDRELEIAAQEHLKITRLRLEKLAS